MLYVATAERGMKAEQATMLFHSSDSSSDRQVDVACTLLILIQCAQLFVQSAVQLLIAVSENSTEGFVEAGEKRNLWD